MYLWREILNMEQSERIFGAPCTTSTAVLSFSNVAVSRFAATTVATSVVSPGPGLFGQPANINTGSSSGSFPFASFNSSAPSTSTHSSAFSFLSAGEPSLQSIAKSKESEVQWLFGKPVLHGPEKDQSDQTVKTAQTSQLEPKRRWNATRGAYMMFNLIVVAYLFVSRIKQLSAKFNRPEFIVPY